jgi:hypothetical protein
MLKMQITGEVRVGCDLFKQLSYYLEELGTALLSTEAEYIALSEVSIEIVFISEILKLMMWEPSICLKMHQL